jgi:protein-S-isoprenylcysteine O-methyltransferase Ste14
MAASLYRAFGYFGIASIFGSMLHGFRYYQTAATMNVFWVVAAYLLWVAVHLTMTRAWFKRAVYGSERSLVGRRFYIVVSVGTWLALLWWHPALPGPSVDLPEVLRFVGCAAFVLSVLAFFEGTTFVMLDGLLAVPGAAMTHSHGGETPLLTEGQYARVRHPMYRAALLAALCSLLLHPNAAQVLWCTMIGATFVGFIPIEERQLLEARGDAYFAYAQVTRWRLFRGLW